MPCNCVQPLPVEYEQTICIADRYRVTLIEIVEGSQETRAIYQICSCGIPSISSIGLELCPGDAPPTSVLVDGEEVEFEIKEVGDPGSFFDFRNIKVDLGQEDDQCQILELRYPVLFTDLSFIRIGIKAGNNTHVGRILGVGDCGYHPK